MSLANVKLILARAAVFLAAPAILALALVFAGCQSQAPSRPAADAGASPSKQIVRKDSDDCLSCHGPFKDLITASANYLAPSGEKISPHRYVPHDSKLATDVPDCVHCHTAHPLDPLPARGSIDLSKVTVDWCFTCHHEKNFKSCKDCH